MLGLLRQSILGISPRAIRCERRGFRVSDRRVGQRIEQIGLAFRRGYHAALQNERTLVSFLEAEPAELRGFAYEGAGLGLALLDRLTLRNGNRIDRFLQGAADPHTYMVHVAVGWMTARWPVSPERVRRGLDPLLGWLLYDGYGFHEGFFRWRKYLGPNPRRCPVGVQGYARNVFDQGLGRSLWFVEGADPGRMATTIAQLSSERSSDLWSGVGLAAAYAGGVNETTLSRLREAAGSDAASLAQGAAFAAKARQRAGFVPEHTDLACRVFGWATARQAACSTDEALENLRFDGGEPAYERWRQRIRARWATNGTEAKATISHGLQP